MEHNTMKPKMFAEENLPGNLCSRKSRRPQRRTEKMIVRPLKTKMLLLHRFISLLLKCSLHRYILSPRLCLGMSWNQLSFEKSILLTRSLESQSSFDLGSVSVLSKYLLRYSTGFSKNSQHSCTLPDSASRRRYSESMNVG